MEWCMSDESVNVWVMFHVIDWIDSIELAENSRSPHATALAFAQLMYGIGHKFKHFMEKLQFLSLTIHGSNFSIIFCRHQTNYIFLSTAIIHHFVWFPKAKKCEIQKMTTWKNCLHEKVMFAVFFSSNVVFLRS